MTAKELVEKIGPGFHPDTPLDEYVKNDDLEPSFTPEEIADMQPVLNEKHDWYGIYMGLFGFEEKIDAIR